MNKDRLASSEMKKCDYDSTVVLLANIMKNRIALIVFLLPNVIWAEELSWDFLDTTVDEVKISWSQLMGYEAQKGVIILNYPEEIVSVYTQPDEDPFAPVDEWKKKVYGINGIDVLFMNGLLKACREGEAHKLSTVTTGWVMELSFEAKRNHEVSKETYTYGGHFIVIEAYLENLENRTSQHK
ncbi:hypothetical protein [Rubellicoccus peritrichatus]|uniref:Uncharacterized protein n=1 Tax=Rubellicoccus peritrichatus TaxID=3080537 RepID=A0AAQ3QW43_9BACT|nr:hypothetical protein [Puniceicoccus sp. CR14]WOO42258.1 hypothetical protein RZN69_04095 [Puniceicoccus sp. CR14]